MDNDADGAKILALLNEWNRRAQGAQWWHARRARRLYRMHIALGVPAVVLSTIVGTSVFASLGQQVAPWAQITVGLVSVLATVLAALQTFLRFSEQAEQNRTASVNYAGLRRDIEVAVLRLKTMASTKESLAMMEGLRNKLEEHLKSSPEMTFTFLNESDRRGKAGLGSLGDISTDDLPSTIQSLEALKPTDPSGTRRSLSGTIHEGGGGAKTQDVPHVDPSGPRKASVDRSGAEPRDGDKAVENET